MTLRQAKEFGLSTLARWSALAVIWQVKFRLSTGEAAVRYFAKKYEADQFASLLIGATVSEAAMGFVSADR